MNQSEILAFTADYLRQLAVGTAGDEEPIEISEYLLRELESASTDVKRELECKLTAQSDVHNYSRSILV